MASYEEHCQNLGKLAAVMLEVVKEAQPLQTFKKTIDSRSHKILAEIENELTSIGNDGLNMVERARRPPCGILLGTSSAGKTELLNSFLPRLRSYSTSTSADTTPMLVRLRYPKEVSNPDHGKLTPLMPRDLYALLSQMPKVVGALRQDTDLADTWDKATKITREPDTKRDLIFEKRLFKALFEWSQKAKSWAEVSGSRQDDEYFKTLAEIIAHFDPEGTHFKPINPVTRNMLIYFLDKGQDEQKLASVLLEKEKMSEQDAKERARLYYVMRTVGAITEVFVEEDILKSIDIYDTAGVRVGGKEADDIAPSQMVHSQIQAFKNRWGFERLVESVDIIIFILVMEEQQVDTEFQSLFEACRKYGHLRDRLFIFLNKMDKATDQAINNKNFKKDDAGRVFPDEEQTWNMWVNVNVMSKIRGLGDDFRNVFLCRAAKFKFAQPESTEFLQNSRTSPTLRRYLYNVERNIDALLDNEDGGIKYAWQTVERVMRQQGSKIRYRRLGQQILPYALDLLSAFSAKRITDETPTDKEIESYLEKLLDDLKELKWRVEEFHLPEKFGEICIQKKFATSRQVEEVLRIQQEEEKETGKKRRIGQILVEKKYMTPDQVREVAQSAGIEQEDWGTYQQMTFDHVRTRVIDQIVTFMEEKGRPIIKGNIPVEAVIQYLTDPINILEQELRGLYNNKERKPFQEAVQNVLECQLTALLWNQNRLRKHLWSQKPRITSSFQIRDDISEEEAIVVTKCYDMLKKVHDLLPPLEKESESESKD